MLLRSLAPARAISQLVSAAAGEQRAFRGEIANVQSLRAVAATLVVFVHLDVFLGLLGLLPFGYGGVDLFFVISGFIMVYTTRRRPLGPGAFLLNRLVRIVPLYWVLTLGVYLVALLAPSLLRSTSTDPAELVQSLLFVPFRKSNGAIQPTLFVGWTLNYALFALGLFLPRREHGVLAVAAVLVVLVVCGHFLPARSAAYSFYSYPIVLEFAMGMGLGLAGERLRVESAVGRRALLVLGVLAFGALAAPQYFLPHAQRVVGTGIPAAVVVAAAIALHQSGWSLSSRLLLALGNASYATYLTHPFVVLAAQRAAARLGSSAAFGALGVALSLVAVWLVGLVVHVAVERPLTSACRRLVATRSRALT